MRRSVKTDLIVYIVHYLYSDLQEEKRLDFVGLFEQQKYLVKDSEGGFWYKGVAWAKSKETKVSNIKPLADTLKESMDLYISTKAALEREIQTVKGYLQSLIASSPELGHLYTLLPSGLKPVLQGRGISEETTTSLPDGISTKYSQKGREYIVIRLMMLATGLK